MLSAESATLVRATLPAVADALRLPDDATVFPCGPLPFMRNARTQPLSAGVPARRVRHEVFGPDQWLPDTAA